MRTGRRPSEIVLVMVAAALSLLGAVTVGASPYQSDYIAVEANVKPFVNTSIINPLRFEIVGAPGTYESVNAAEYTLEANVPVIVQLKADPLSYEADDSIHLDVVYWVDHESNSFKPGTPININLGYSVAERHTLQLRGRVTIHDIAGQPAGAYHGKIWITVSAQ